jgi:hypothetical protein
MQHHQGAVLVPLAGAVIAWEHWTSGVPGAWVRALGRFSLGVLLVLVPLAVHLVWIAGVRMIFESLIVFPLGGYRAHNRLVSYGHSFPGIVEKDTSPAFVAALPLVAVGLAVARAGWLVVRDGDTARRRHAVAVAVACAGALVSIAYYADFVHLAFIGPIEAIGVAFVAEAGCRAASPVVRRGAHVACGVALAALGVQLAAVGVRSHRAYPYACDSAFGTVWFESEFRCTALANAARELRDAGVRDVFAYPLGSWVNLLTGTVNPTRFSFLVPGYDPPDHYRTAIKQLAHHRDAWVVVWMPLRPDDPIGRLLARAYARVHPDDPTSAFYRLIRPRRIAGDNATTTLIG